MKPKKKKKFDIKSFFILNVEKIALILIVPLAIYIAYQGTLYEPLKWQPNELQQISEAADTNIKTNERKASDEGVSIFPYDTKATWIKRKVHPDLYRTEVSWMPALFPEKIKRGAVPVFTVYDLKAQSGLGAITVNPASPLAANLTSPRIGKRWTVLTGLIPIKKQLDEYVSAYSSSVMPDPVRDMPMYWFYDVERAEVVPGKGLDGLEWKKMEIPTTFFKNTSLWSTFSVDPVDPNYIAPMAGPVPMAYPLPPIDKPFGAEVAHPPVIPVLTESQTELLKQMEDLHKKMIDKMFDVKQEDILGGDPFGGLTGSRDGGGMPGGGPVGGPSISRKRTAADSDDEIKPVLVEDYLFRFFDFDVESGKTYRYRVRLYLANPNYKLAPNYLSDESLSKEPQLLTDYSTASNSVTIPLESRILATAVTAPAPRTPWLDPTVSILAVKFDMSDGSEWCAEVGANNKSTRGSAINFTKQEAINYALEGKTATGMGDEMMGGPPRGGTRPGARPSAQRPGSRPTATRPGDPRAKAAPEDESKKVIDVVSNVCLLDMVGGAPILKISRDKDALDLRSPGKIVVLEPSGNMVIRHVNSDLAEVNLIKNPPVSSGTGRGGFDSMPMGGGSMGGP